MRFQANRSITLKNIGRIAKGDDVTILKAIGISKVKIVQIITKDFSFRTTQGIADKYFFSNK